MGLPRFAVILLLAAALSAPFVLIVRAGHALLAPLSRAAVEALLRVTAPLQPAPAPPAAVEVAYEDEAPTELAAQRASKTPARGAKLAPKAPPALFVSRATVLQLAQSAARPRGSFVSAAPSHPAGLRLSGVAALGIGVQDGDILVEAMGMSPRASSEIVGAVLAARAKHVEALSGTLWRRGQTFRITVQQPY